MTASQLAAQQGDLAAAMEERGDWPDRSPWIRHAVENLPRDQFAPDLLWHWNGDTYTLVDRTADPTRWAAEVYAGPNDPAVTQVLDGRATSSLSCPAIVVDMLDSLLLQPGHRALELGTGTGWNAALMAWRTTGQGQVTSVEVDPDLAAQARRRLAAAGLPVAVQVADGAVGWPPGAPYDRVISTYAVDNVPWSWVAQTRPGGRIVTPWGRLGHVALTVADDGQSATGWMQGLAQFMPARGADPSLSWHEVRGNGPPQEQRPLNRDLHALPNAHLLFALRVVLPDVQIITTTDDQAVTAWLHDGVASWATLDGDQNVAYLGGPRDLVEELGHGWEQWTAQGEPDLYDFGMTVEPEHQWVWCQDPHNHWPAAV